MALITKVEVSNFLNTERVDPWDPAWKAHWPHLCLDFDGENAIGRVDNGRGKTRLCNAIFTILTRDRTLHAETKRLLAPSKKGISSHIRIEVKQQITTGRELFESGVEHYVMGLYGCYDKDITFYLYQGKLSDCPVAFIQNEDGSKKIELVTDKQFKEVLKNQKGYQNRNRSEYIEAVSLLFDMGFLQQQLNYQKSGGGDGTGNFFSLQNSHPKGEDFSTSFFYEHIAPHLLMDVMGSFAEEDEKHFVDTLVKSSRKVIAVEIKQEKAEQDRDAYNDLFDWLFQANTLIEDYQNDEALLHKQVNLLNHQLAMINRITCKEPLERLVAPIDCEPLEGNQVSKNSIANQLSYHEGEWLISDMVLAQYLTSSVSSINKLLQEKGVFLKKIKTEQAIEISRNLKNTRDPRGKQNSYYTQADVKILMDLIGDNRIITEGGKEHLRRSINYAFDIRNKLPSPNPVYDELCQFKGHIEKQKLEQKELQEENKQLGIQRKALQDSIEKYELNEQAYIAMCESSDFTKVELETPTATLVTIEKSKNDNDDRYEALHNRNAALSPFREHYNVAKNMFGELEDYSSQLEELEKISSELKVKKEELEKELNDRSDQLDTDRGTLTNFVQEVESQQVKLNEMLSKQNDYDAVKDYYSDSELATTENLPNNLKKEVDIKNQTLDAAKQFYQTLANKLEQLELVVDDYHFVFSKFKCDNPQQFLTNKYTRKNELTAQISKHETVKAQLDEGLNRLPAVSKSFGVVKDYFSSLFPDVGIGAIENCIENKLSEVKAQLFELDKEWSEQFDLQSAIEQFESKYDKDIDSVITQINTEYRNKAEILGRKKKELISLNTQYQHLKENGEITPSNLVNQILSELEFSGETVHQVVSGMGLTEKKLAKVLAEFSSVLHAPVVETGVQATEMLECLIDAGMDYPVFYREKLIAYCKDSNSTSALLSYESLHVKVLKDSNYLPELLLRLEVQISELKQEINDTEIAIQAISPESDQYIWLQRVKQAFRQDIPRKIISCSERVDETAKEYERLNNIKASREFLLIKIAKYYEQIGGDEKLNSTIEQLIDTETLLIGFAVERDELNSVLTDKNIVRFQNSIRFIALGGIDKLKQLEIDLNDNELKQEQLKAEVVLLNNKEIQCYARLASAQLFVNKGGLSAIKSLSRKLAEIKPKMKSLSQHVENEGIECRKLSQKVLDLSENYTRANGKYSEWKTPLTQAALFVKEAGPVFDLSYTSEKYKLFEEKRLLERKLKFNFEQAQAYVDIKSDENYNATLISKIQSINETIINNDDLVQKITDDIEDNQEKIPDKAFKAKEYQEEYVKFMHMHHLASELTSYLQTELEITFEATELNPFTKYAINIEAEIREDQTRDLNQTAELYLNLFDAIEGLGLEVAHEEISALTKTINNKQNDIVSTIKKNLETDKVIREAERQELIHGDIRRIILAVNKLKPHIEQTAIDKEQIVERTAEDVKNQKQTLANNMVLLTNTLKENLKLMKSSLGKGSGQAGFILDSNVISDEQIQGQIDKMITSVRIEEERFQSDLINADRLVSKTESQHIAQLQEKLKLEFNRSVFVGSDDKNNNLPSIKVIHPRLTADRLVPLSEMFSVGQKAAIGLLLLVKLAAFNSERVNNTSTVNRAKRSLIADKVVLIDGLFSNLSDRKMINDSLETVMNIKDEFQIIGWLHNPYYKNNFDIFPRFYNISPANRKGVLLHANQIKPDENTQMASMTLQLEQEEFNA
jgi:hypothetical protein